VELQIPKLSHDSYCPFFLIPRCFWEATLTLIIQETTVPGARRTTSIVWCKLWTWAELGAAKFPDEGKNLTLGCRVLSR